MDIAIQWLIGLSFSLWVGLCYITEINNTDDKYQYNKGMQTNQNAEVINSSNSGYLGWIVYALYIILSIAVVGVIIKIQNNFNLLTNQQLHDKVNNFGQFYLKIPWNKFNIFSLLVPPNSYFTKETIDFKNIINYEVGQSKMQCLQNNVEIESLHKSLSVVSNDTCKKGNNSINLEDEKLSLKEIKFPKCPNDNDFSMNEHQRLTQEITYLRQTIKEISQSRSILKKKVNFLITEINYSENPKLKRICERLFPLKGTFSVNKTTNESIKSMKQFCNTTEVLDRKPKSKLEKHMIDSGNDMLITPILKNGIKSSFSKSHAVIDARERFLHFNHVRIYRNDQKYLFPFPLIYHKEI